MTDILCVLTRLLGISLLAINKKSQHLLNLVKPTRLVAKNGLINGRKNKIKKYFMGINYNKREHLELLKRKSVIVNTNSEDCIKLRRYSMMTIGSLNWCIREHYLDLLENFRKGKLQTFDFCLSFDNTGRVTSDILDILESNLILLAPNDVSLGFSDLLEEIFDACEAYLQDPEFRDENSDVELKNSVEESYFKIQNFLTEE